MSNELVSKCITTTTSGMDTIILPTPKRITVYSKPPEEDCVVISLSPDTITSIDDLYHHLERLFHMDDGEIKALYNAFGARICDIDAIRDEEILYLQKDRVEKAATPATSKPLRLARCRSGDWLTLNVGGQNFMTTRSTLVEQVQESMLARMFSSTDDASWQSKVDENGAFLIDRSPKYFEPILNYLRHGQLVLDKNLNPQGVLEEAKFFGIFPLIEQLEQMVKESQIPQETAPMTRREFVFKLVGSETGKELRCQGVNFTGANLSKLDLRSINFKYAIFKGADLSGCNLSHCNFERADFTQAKLDGALLLGAKLLCATLEEASICSANFEDPAGTRANMEGAHMKQVNLEGSHMSGVNLRVANLKNANLQNCNLRGAVLAGADLENCNLSGCDLQEANLRGANLKGAAFELMLNPLHMAQTVR